MVTFIIISVTFFKGDRTMNIEIDYEVFRKRLRQLIDSRSTTVKELSYELNITPATLSRYLSGARTPDPLYLVRLSRYFDVSIDWLLGINGDKFDVLPEEVQEIAHLYQVATLNDRRVVKTLLEKYNLPEEE